MKKLCTKCRCLKSLKDFNKDKTRKDGFYPQCRECKHAWYHADPSRKKQEELKHRYGLTLEQFTNLLKQQNNCCKICRISFEETVPFVDHCHSTGKIRGLLCRYCNTMLGNAKDSPQILLAGITYLTGHDGQD